MSEINTNCEALRDEHIDAMLRLALQYREKCEIEKLIAQEDIGLSADEEQLAQRTYRNFEQKLAAYEKAEKKKLRRARYKKTAPRVLEIAACLVLALGIAAPVAIASNSSVRVQVMKLLISLDDGHVDVGMEEDTEASFDVPAEWTGKYYPSYIPEGYSIGYVDTGMPGICYAGEDNKFIYYFECDSATTFGIDSEDSVVKYEEINGQMCTIITSNAVTSVSWSDGSYMFVISTTECCDEAINIVKNVRRIK